MDIRQLEYLAALAREKHFTRAAQACNVTQPTLSGRIRQLELELGVPIVSRDQRFQGFTPEGERVLKWAHAILANWHAMEQELAQLNSEAIGLSGKLIIGGIPSALPMIPQLTSTLRKEHPDIEFTIHSLSSIEILRRLGDNSLDAGVTYLDNEPIEGLLTSHLYTERYCLFVGEDHPLAGRDVVTWREAAEKPLCLLTPNMQNRRIIDRAFAQSECRPKPKIETDSIINLCSNVRMGLASVMPEFVLDLLGPGSGIAAIPLGAPTVEHAVGLVVSDRDPLPPLLRALRTAANSIVAPPKQARRRVPMS